MSESSTGRTPESSGLTRPLLRGLVATKVFAQPASEDVLDALIDVLVAFGTLRSESRGFVISTSPASARTTDAATAAALLRAIEDTMRSRPVLAVLVPVLRGRSSRSSSHGSADQQQALHELQSLEQSHDAVVRQFGHRLEVSARMLVGYVISVRRSRLGMKASRVGTHEAQLAAEERARAEAEHAQRKAQALARVSHLIWLCTYNHAPDELGVLPPGPTYWSRIGELDWRGYAQRWVAERIVPALRELRDAADTLSIDFLHTLDVMSTVHDQGKRQREELVRREIMRLGEDLENPDSHALAAATLGESLQREAHAYRHFHDYFEGLAATVDRHVRRSRTAALPAVPMTDLKAIDPARIDVRLLDGDRAECSVDGVIVSRLSSTDLTPRDWQLLIQFFKPEPDQAATARVDKRSRTRIAGDLDEPAYESTDAVEGDQLSTSHVSKSTVPGLAHLRDAEQRKGVASQSATRRAADRKAMRRLNRRLVERLNLTRDPFVAVRGEGQRSLFKSTIWRAGVE